MRHAQLHDPGLGTARLAKLRQQKQSLTHDLLTARAPSRPDAAETVAMRCFDYFVY